MYRFFAENISSFEGDLVLTAAAQSEIVEQLGKVLRVKAGDTVILVPSGNDGPAASGPPFFEYEYEVASAHKKEVRLSFVKKIKNRNELDFGLELVLCLPNKPDKLSLILQKVVELGVSRVVLVEGENSQLKHSLREDRLRKIMTEAAEQSERAVVPELEVRGLLSEYLQGAGEGLLAQKGGAGLLVAMEREDGGRLEELAQEALERDGKVAILIGPEGGFSEKEKDLIQKRGLRCFTLGRRILRMETAAIVALGVVSTRG